MTEPVVVSTPVGPLETNCYTVSCRKTGQVLVIDPGFDAGAVRKTFSSLETVLFTHGHFDHVGAASGVVQGFNPRILMHIGDEPMLGGAASYGAEWGFAVSNPPAPTGFLSNGEVLEIGELSFTVIHTPGHSPGSLCLYGHGVLFSGDTLFNGSIGRTDLPGSSAASMRDSLQRLLEQVDNRTKVYPGHGPASVFGHERRHNPFLAFQAGALAP